MVLGECYEFKLPENQDLLRFPWLRSHSAGGRLCKPEDTFRLSADTFGRARSRPEGRAGESAFARRQGGGSLATMHSPELASKLAAFRALKPSGRKVVMLTAADYPGARLLDEAGIDLILVGDSMGMVTLGFADTVDVTLDDMVHHTRAVRRGVRRALVGADLPWHSYESPRQAVASARALVAAGADAVKLEGGRAMLPQIEAIIADGIPFIGHIGMLPQSVREEGGYKKKGKTADQAALLLDDARAVDGAGALAIVFEGIVPAVAAEMTRAIECPSIGIGSGTDCDGQILVTADLTGAFPWFRPPFARARGDVAGEISRAAREFAAEVRGEGEVSLVEIPQSR